MVSIKYLFKCKKVLVRNSKSLTCSSVSSSSSVRAEKLPAAPVACTVDGVPVDAAEAFGVAAGAGDSTRRTSAAEIPLPLKYNMVHMTIFPTIVVISSICQRNMAQSFPPSKKFNEPQIGD